MASGAISDDGLVGYTLMSARAMGLWAMRVHAGRGRSYQQLAPPGTPDCLVISPRGQAVWIECKRKGAKPRTGQIRQHTRLRATGALVAVLDDREQVQRFLQRVRRMDT